MNKLIFTPAIETIIEYTELENNSIDPVMRLVSGFMIRKAEPLVEKQFKLSPLWTRKPHYYCPSAEAPLHLPAREPTTEELLNILLPSSRTQ